MSIELTVIIAAWNAAKTIERCIFSALHQTDVNLEVIVCDDCSTDETRHIVEYLATLDERVRLVCNSHNMGPAGARNLAIERSDGEWIAILDADDRVLPQRARVLLDFARSSNADVVFDNLQIILAENETALSKDLFLDPVEFSCTQEWNLPYFLKGNLTCYTKRSLGYLKPILSRQFLDRHCIRYNETLHNSEDFHIIAECLVKNAAVWFYPDAYYQYTIRRGSISHRVQPEHLEALLNAEKTFAYRHKAELGPDVLQLLEQRRKEIFSLLTTEIVLTSLKRGNMRHALTAAARNPSSLYKIYKHLCEATSRRLQRG